MAAESAETDRPRRRTRTFWPLALGLALAPLTYELTSTTLSRWRRLAGLTSSEVSTPISDATFTALDGSWRLAWATVLSLAETAGAHPTWALGIAAFWMVLGGGFLLRKS